MSRRQKEKSTGSKGFGPNEAQSLARWGGRDRAGTAAPSSSACNRHGWRVRTGAAVPSLGNCKKIATCNVKSLNVPGKTVNLIKEMQRLGVNIMGVSETWWDKAALSQHNSQIAKKEIITEFSSQVERRRGEMWALL